jgi:hypothetical protein
MILHSAIIIKEIPIIFRMEDNNIILTTFASDF